MSENAAEKKPGKKRVAFILILIFAVLLIGSCVGGYIYTASLMHKNFTRSEYTDPRFTASYRYDHYAADYPREEVSFTSGENTLKGWIYGMDNDKGLIVFAHGIGCGHESYINLLMRLVDCGWRVFAYDATGSCESEGESTVGLAQSALDLDCALTFAEGDERLNSLPVFVLGHSWGGYAAAAVLNFDHDVKASVSMSGYYTPMAELKENADRMMGGISPVSYPFIWIYNKLSFGKYSSLSAVDGINHSGIPVLIIHGNADETVEYDGASIISQKDEITNTNVQYYTFSEEGRNSHNSFFYTPEYAEYKAEYIDPRREEIKEEYGDDIPDEVREEFAASIDPELYNGTSDELVDLISGFFEKQLVENK